MNFFPIFLDLREQACLVVGAGTVAERKVGSLLRAHARLQVVAPEATPGVIALAEEGRLMLALRPFAESDLDGARLVVAATSDRTVNRQVSKAARDRGIPVNVVDQPELCSFIMPSVIDRSPVIAAVSTGGSSPVLARLIRARLESVIPAGYGRLAELCNRFRDRVKRAFTDPEDRRIFWDQVLQGGVAERVFSGHGEEAERLMEEALARPRPDAAMGEVYLVGAGPGDPDLITFRALRLMQQADVVVYDRLVAQPILDMVRHDAQRVYVGKERANHTMRQEKINELLVRLAKQGKRVVRLKGGDPFIFGRGGEEIDTLAAEGVPFQVIPGITAASGCASYSGIPLTHRDYAQSVTFVTGHLKDDSCNLNWRQLAEPHQTVVFYMGLLGLPVICRELRRHGVAATMPVALVQQGTTHNQRVFTGTLETILDIVERERPQAPTLVIVGEVVRLRDKLSWFERLEPAGAAPSVFEPRMD